MLKQAALHTFLACGGGIHINSPSCLQEGV